MSDFYTAITWLNHFDKSNLNEATRFLIDKFQEANEKGDDTNQEAGVVEAAAKAAKNPSATAEALILIAEHHYRAGRLKLAWARLMKAAQIYLDEQQAKETRAALHRLWVARWLCGWVAWKMGVNYTAYKMWLGARDDIEKLVQNSIDVEDADKEKWYRAVQYDMDIDLACRAEEVFTWLYNIPVQSERLRNLAKKKGNEKLATPGDAESDVNIVRATKMGNDLVRILDKVVVDIIRAEEEQVSIEKAGEGDLESVRQNVKQLLDALELRSDFDERAEALLECGLALHQIQDHRQASECIERAVSNYPPGSHQKAVSRWLLGIMQIQPEARTGRAYDSFRKAIDELDMLNQRAGTANNKPLVDWYTRKLAILEKAVDRMREEAQALH